MTKSKRSGKKKVIRKGKAGAKRGEGKKVRGET